MHATLALAPGELALWIGLAFVLWLMLTLFLDLLRMPARAVVAALASWLVARLLLSMVPDVAQGAATALQTWIG